MWQKVLLIIFLFFVFIFLQNSFFAYFGLFGAVPNLVFVFFFLLAFFSKKNQDYQIIYAALLAGILLDLSYYNYLGPSIVIFLIIGFLLKKTQSALQNREENYPLAYFLPICAVFFILYEVLTMIYLQFFDSTHTQIIFDFRFAGLIIYNLIFALIGFWVFKKIAKHAKQI